MPLIEHADTDTEHIDFFERSSIDYPDLNSSADAKSPATGAAPLVQESLDSFRRELYGGNGQAENRQPTQQIEIAKLL